MEVYLGDLDRLLRVTTKERSSTCFEEKSAPPEKILATPMRIHEKGPHLTLVGLWGPRMVNPVLSKLTTKEVVSI